ncbi:MAG: exosortase H [Candidatus Krumholzibacteriia bacterium]
MLRFVVTFAVVAVVLFCAYWTTEVTGRFRHVNELNAVLSGAVLNVLGVANVRSGTVVSFRSGGMEIISECSGIYVAILFAAGIFAFPTAWRIRLRGLALGLAAIFVINVLRLVTLGAVIAHKESLLPLFHEYLWQVFFILVVSCLYLLWIERMVPREPLARGT